MPNARFRAYLSIYKEVLNQTWSRGVVGATPCNIQIVLSHKVLKCHLILRVLIPIHHCFGFSDIFCRGSQDPKDPPGFTPVLSL